MQILWRLRAGTPDPHRHHARIVWGILRERPDYLDRRAILATPLARRQPG